MLSGLSRSAGLVIAAKADLRLRHIEFIRLEPQKALVVLVGENGMVENRVIALPAGRHRVLAAGGLELPQRQDRRAHASRRRSRNLTRLHAAARNELDALAQKLVDTGLAVWAGSAEKDPGRLIVSAMPTCSATATRRKTSTASGNLFDELESKENLMRLLELTEDGEGVRIFIGSENKLFPLSGSSLVVAPYRDKDQRVIGALGVIGPTRMNYARIVPMVDFTAQVVTRLLR